MVDAKRDQNYVTTLIGVSSVDGVTPVTVWVDPVTHRLLIQNAAGGLGTVTSVSVTTANGVSGSVATATTTPAITITLGAITPTSVNGLTITSTTGTLTLTNAKTLSVTNTLTFSGTDGSTLNIGTGGTLGTGAYATIALYATLISPSFTTPTLGVASATSLATSAATPFLLTNGQLVNIALTSQTVGATTLTIPNFASVSDTFVFVTLAQTLSNKTFVAPVLGVATATSINGLTITATTGTLTVTNAKTLSVSNSLTLAGTDGKTLTLTTGLTVTTNDGTLAFAGASNTFTFPSGSSTVMTLASADTVAGVKTFNDGSLKLTGATSGASTLKAPAIASTYTHTLPAMTTTLASVGNTTETTNTATVVAIAGIRHVHTITALATANTIGVPTVATGALNDTCVLILRIKDNATARALTWNAIFRASSDLALPSTTVLSKTLYCGFQYNVADTKWDLIAVLNNI